MAGQNDTPGTKQGVDAKVQGIHSVRSRQTRTVRRLDRVRRSIAFLVLAGHETTGSTAARSLLNFSSRTSARNGL